MEKNFNPFGQVGKILKASSLVMLMLMAFAFTANAQSSPNPLSERLIDFASYKIKEAKDVIASGPVQRGVEPSFDVQAQYAQIAFSNLVIEAVKEGVPFSEAVNKAAEKLAPKYSSEALEAIKADYLDRISHL